MRTLIIPDVHHRWEMVENIIARERYDKIVFTGDYFDARGELDTIFDAGATARWLKNSLQDPRRIHLWGNHDISYGFDSWIAYCSGYSERKDHIIWQWMTRADFSKLKFFHIEQDWLLTHAGLHPHFLPPMWQEKDVTCQNISEYLDKESAQFEHNLLLNSSHWFITTSERRDRSAIGVKQGGILWCDSREFQPIKGISQIFGHTVQIDNPCLYDGQGRILNGVGSLEERTNSSEGLDVPLCQRDNWNVCLDCNSKFYGVIEDGCLSIKPAILNENKT